MNTPLVCSGAVAFAGTLAVGVLAPPGLVLVVPCVWLAGFLLGAMEAE